MPFFSPLNDPKRRSRKRKKQNKIRAHRPRLLEEAFIDLVHGREVGHIRDIHIDFNAVLQRAAGFFEDCGKVFEALGLLRG